MSNDEFSTHGRQRRIYAARALALWTIDNAQQLAETRGNTTEAQFWEIMGDLVRHQYPLSDSHFEYSAIKHEFNLMQKGYEGLL